MLMLSAEKLTVITFIYSAILCSHSSHSSLSHICTVSHALTCLLAPRSHTNILFHRPTLMFLGLERRTANRSEHICWDEWIIQSKTLMMVKILTESRWVYAPVMCKYTRMMRKDECIIIRQTQEYNQQYNIFMGMLDVQLRKWTCICHVANSFNTLF